jgi:hypothetical protein
MLNNAITRGGLRGESDIRYQTSEVGPIPHGLVPWEGKSGEQEMIGDLPLELALQRGKPVGGGEISNQQSAISSQQSGVRGQRSAPSPMGLSHGKGSPGSRR